MNVLGGPPDCSIDTVSELAHRCATGTSSEGLAQGPYVASRVGFEPRGVTSFPWALVQGSRTGPCLTFKAHSHALLHYIQERFSWSSWTPPRPNA